MNYTEYDLRTAAKFVGMKPKELKAVKDENENMFYSIMLGAVILESGIEFGEALFKLRDRPELDKCVKELERLKVELNKAKEV